MTTSSTLSRTAAGLFALCLGSGGDLLAAAAPEPGAPVERPIVDKIGEKIDDAIGQKIGEKIGEKIDAVIGEKTVARIDDAHADQERFFGQFFEKIDRVFGEQYVEDRERKVRVGAGLETTFNADGTSTDTKVKVALRVPLPAMNRRLNAFIDIGGDVNELGAVSSLNFSESEKSYSLAAGLLHRIREDLEAGVKLKVLSAGEVFSVNPFVRFEQKNDSMRYFFEQRLIWESDNSWGSLTNFDVDRRFRSGLFLRLSNRIDYPFEDPGAAIAHGLIVRRGVFDTNGLSFELWLEYNTAKDDPTTIEDDTTVHAQLRLRGRIWRNWLEYELRPIYTIPTNTDRSAFFGFLVSLTVVWDSYLGGNVLPDATPDR